MKTENIKAVDFNLEAGFFWIEFNNGENLQACLMMGKRGYVKQLNRKDCGFDWGICGEVNQWAFDEYEADEVLAFILKHARKAGLRMV